MSLTISVVPASTAAGRDTIRALLADPAQPNIRAIYRNTSKALPEFTSNPRFKAVKGDVSDSSCLDFEGSDAVFYIPPPTYDGLDSETFATIAANNVKAALEKASSVKRLLIFSALGSESESNVGIIIINHVSDKILCKAAPEVVIIRPGFFMEFWTSRLDTLKEEKPYIESFISPADHPITMVALSDIAEASAKHLLATGQKLSENPYVFTMHGPREYSANDVRNAFQEILKKDVGVSVVEKHDLEGYFAGQMPQPYAKEMADMVVASLPGGVVAEAMKVGTNPVRGNIELVDFFRDTAGKELTE